MKREVILVEPGAHLSYGHYQEKLGLWARAFQASEWTVTVVCSERPSKGAISGLDYSVIPTALTWLSRLLPDRIRIYWLVFSSYLSAFRLAMRTEAYVLGCTTSSLLPVAAARIISRMCGKRFAQIIMYGNMFDKKSRWARGLAQWSLTSLLRAGSAILPNTERTRLKFIKQIEDPSLQARITSLYDPIYISPTPVPDEAKSPELPFLICGMDGGRRTPVAHLEKAQLDPAPRRILLHLPGSNIEDHAKVRSRVAHLTSEVSVSTDYVIRDDLHDLCASASCCLLAYHQSISQGSGYLAQSVIAGTPVLCSRFPHALELFDQFGRLGELFEFDDTESLQAAWLRLCSWGPEQWAEFHEARKQLTEQVDPLRNASVIIGFFCPDSA